MKSGHSAFLVFLNRDHVSAYKMYDIDTEYILKLCIFQLTFCNPDPFWLSLPAGCAL